MADDLPFTNSTFAYPDAEFPDDLSLSDNEREPPSQSVPVFSHLVPLEVKNVASVDPAKFKEKLREYFMEDVEVQITDDGTALRIETPYEMYREQVLDIAYMALIFEPPFPTFTIFHDHFQNKYEGPKRTDSIIVFPESDSDPSGPFMLELEFRHLHNPALRAPTQTREAFQHDVILKWLETIPEPDPNFERPLEDQRRTSDEFFLAGDIWRSGEYSGLDDGESEHGKSATGMEISPAMKESLRRAQINLYRNRAGSDYSYPVAPLNAQSMSINTGLEYLSRPEYGALRHHGASLGMGDIVVTGVEQARGGISINSIDKPKPPKEIPNWEAM